MLFATSIASGILSAIFIYLIIKHSSKLGLIDRPTDRSMHKKPIPRGAGIGFVSASFIGIAASVIFNIYSSKEYVLIYFAIAIVFLAGIIDDKKSVLPRLKFLFIILAATIVSLDGIYIKSLGNFSTFEITLPYYFAIAFTIFAITGFTNALNLIDGLDGLAASLSVALFTVFLWIGFNYNDDLMIILSSIFLCTTFAFVFFNWHPAKVFMGDSGSLTLGFVISILAVRATNYLEATAVLFIVVLPVLDTFIVMVRRKQRGLSLFSPDKTHIHHILYQRYEDVSYTVILLLYIQIAFMLIGIQLKDADGLINLILFGILFFIMLILFDQRKKKRKKEKKRAFFIKKPSSYKTKSTSQS